jgi:hypothetical protein
MIGKLPITLPVCGREYRIRTDFRDILVIYQALEDKSLSKEEQALVALRCLYYDWDKLPRKGKGLEEAIKQAFWFIGGGDVPKTKPDKIRIIDWEKDGHMIYPAVSKTLGVIDIRTMDYLHWFTFLGSFGEQGDGLLNFVLHLRRKMAKRKEKLDKAEREFLRNNKDLVVIRDREEQEAIEETEKFLESII